MSDTQHQFNSIKRFKDWAARITNKPQIRWLVRTVFSLVFTLIGALSYAIFIPETGLLFSEKLFLYIAAMIAILGTPFLVLKRLLELEVADGQLRLMETQQESANIDREGISEEIARHVKARVDANIGMLDYAYEERATHYRSEKEYLAKCLCGLLGERVEHLLQGAHREKRIKIVLDAGTTVAPIFEELARLSLANPECWINNVDLITNNLRGIEILFRNKALLGKGEDDRYGPIPIQCHVLPGAILSAFQAIADSETVSAILKLKDESTHIISVTTGNYIFIDNDEHQFLPIARQGMHPNNKAALYSVSDEIYSISPLGKILRTSGIQGISGASPGRISAATWQFNQDLKLRDDDKCGPGNKGGAECPYKLVEPHLLDGFDHNFHQQLIGDWNKKSVLVTSSRRGGKLLSKHFNTISGALHHFDPNDPFSGTDGGAYVWNCGDMIFPALTVDEEMELEIPHEYMRPLKDKYFWLQSADPE